MTALMREVDVVSPGGIFLRRDVVFDLDQRLLHQFAERVARALLRFEFEQAFFKGTFEWSFNPKLPDQAYTGLAQFGRVRKVHDVFAYGVMGFGDSDNAWAVANFYGAAEMFIRVQKV